MEKSSTPAGWNDVAVALGSNVGEAPAHLDFAVRRLADHLIGLRTSTWRVTTPVDVAPQPDFLNGVVTGRTRLSARALLAALLAIERERGRVRPHAGAPRTLDLDLILFGTQVIHEPGLRVPHPRYRTRAFVLEPLAEIAADWVDPETGQTMADMWKALAPGQRR